MCRHDIENTKNTNNRFDPIPRNADNIGQWNMRYRKPLKFAMIFMFAE